MMINVKGQTVDNQTRCVHYHTEKDIIAIKFACCNEFYPCYKCHDEACEHERKQWPKTQFEEKAILCGHCQSLLTISDYLCTAKCLSCEHSFNPNCSLHAHLYFE